jgi:hypothetical protein
MWLQYSIFFDTAYIELVGLHVSVAVDFYLSLCFFLSFIHIHIYIHTLKCFVQAESTLASDRQAHVSHEDSLRRESEHRLANSQRVIQQMEESHRSEMSVMNKVLTDARAAHEAGRAADEKRIAQANLQLEETKASRIRLLEQLAKSDTRVASLLDDVKRHEATLESERRARGNAEVLVLQNTQRAGKINELSEAKAALEAQVAKLTQEKVDEKKTLLALVEEQERALQAEREQTEDLRSQLAGRISALESAAESAQSLEQRNHELLGKLRLTSRELAEVSSRVTQSQAIQRTSDMQQMETLRAEHADALKTAELALTVEQRRHEQALEEKSGKAEEVVELRNKLRASEARAADAEQHRNEVVRLRQAVQEQRLQIDRTTLHYTEALQETSRTKEVLMELQMKNARTEHRHGDDVIQNAEQDALIQSLQLQLQDKAARLDVALTTLDLTRTERTNVESQLRNEFSRAQVFSCFLSFLLRSYFIYWFCFFVSASISYFSALLPRSPHSELHIAIDDSSPFLCLCL